MDGDRKFAGFSYCESHCDLQVIQRRFDGSVDFNRNWKAYKDGFGSPASGGEYWFGLEKIHKLTTMVDTSLRIDLWDEEGGHL